MRRSVEIYTILIMGKKCPLIRYLPVGCPNGSVAAGCVFVAGGWAPNGSVGLAPNPFDEFDGGNADACPNGSAACDGADDPQGSAAAAVVVLATGAESPHADVDVEGWGGGCDEGAPHGSAGAPNGSAAGAGAPPPPPPHGLKLLVWGCWTGSGARSEIIRHYYDSSSMIHRQIETYPNWVDHRCYFEVFWFAR